MPFIGLSPFLPAIINTMILYGDVSMPFIGLSPFLHTMKNLIKNLFGECQCPLSGFLHFYGIKGNVPEYLEFVSMPFIGLSPFLQRKRN